ncbi:YciI family protein [Cryobacterium sp. TMS1-20-1]|uniref:YciI family protein n=1 Tax=Cryobacterium sp. TMS1-20-1 TaxID=1259223 RepID=UPI00141B0751
MRVFAVRYGYDRRNEGARCAALPGHRSWLQGLLDDELLIGAGIFPDGTGAMLLLLAEDEPSVRRCMDQDPYALEGLIVDVQVTHWAPSWGPVSALAAGKSG